MRNLIITIFGKKFSGKSYLLKNQILPLFKRVVIFDTQNEYNYPGDFDEMLQSKFEFFNTPDDLLNRVEQVHQNAEFYLVMKTSSREDIQSSIIELTDFGYMTLVIEEIHLFENRSKDFLYNLYMTGRHKLINICGTAQRFSSVTRDLTSQSDVIISLQQTEPIDIKTAAGYNSELAKELPGLSQGEFRILQGFEIYDDLSK